MSRPKKEGTVKSKIRVTLDLTPEEYNRVCFIRDEHEQTSLVAAIKSVIKREVVHINHLKKGGKIKYTDQNGEADAVHLDWMKYKTT